MCDYSLESVRSRPAKVGDKLVTTDFGTLTRGFASIEDRSTAVCVLPGTEIAFAQPVHHFVRLFRPMAVSEYKTAIFRQINKGTATTHAGLLANYCCSIVDSVEDLAILEQEGRTIKTTPGQPRPHPLVGIIKARQ